MADEIVKRGRKPIEIDKNEFQKTVSDLEASQVFGTRTLLWAAVEETEWAKTRVQRPLTAQVALMRAEEMGLEIKTEKGKRGRSKGQGPVNGGGRKKKFFDISKVVAGIPLEERPGLEKTILKAANGSLKSRIKLMCLDCVSWQKGEVAVCEIFECPLHQIRPYKRASVVKELL